MDGIIARAVADRAAPDPFQPSAPTPAHALLQRTVVFKGHGEHAVSAEFVLRRLLESRHALPGDADRRFVEQLHPRVVTRALRRLRESATAYGTFDLSNDIDLQFLYYELRKEIHKPSEAEDPATEIEASKQRATKDDTERRAYRYKAPDIGKTFDLALLGTGAAIAYYVTSHKHEIDPALTIVIGQLQPWADKRGPGVVNHPMHMITPEREAVGIGKEALAPRKQLSDSVASVIRENVGYHLDAKITSVKRKPHNGVWFYEIAFKHAGTPDVYYARHVVFGLGIGEHKPPAPRKDDEVREQPSLGGRAMDMDEFQRRAKEIRGGAKKKRPDITVVIAGPNAGIDAVKTAMGCGFTIIWVTGSQRPGFLPGTDNEPVEDEYEKREKGAESKIHKIVKDYAFLAAENPKKGPTEKPIVVDIGKEANPERNVLVESRKPEYADYYIWAQGPNVAQIKAILTDELAGLVESYDRNRQFAPGAAAAVVGLEAGTRKDAADETSLQIVGGAAYRLAEGRDYGYVVAQRQEAKTLLASAAERAAGFRVISADDGKLLEQCRSLARQADAYLDEAPSPPTQIKAAKKKSDLPAVAVLALRDLPSLEAHLKSPRRRRAALALAYSRALRQALAYSSALKVFTQEVADYFDAMEEFQRAPKPLDPRLATPRPTDPRTTWGQMAKVTSTLPLNVLINDQLTPTRSQIEAAAAYVPGYVRDDANFATDSATVLRIYVSVHYPFLPDAQVDEWIDRIIRWRRPSNTERERYAMLWGPIPNPNNADRESAASFTAWFKQRLGEEEAKAKRAA